MDAWGRRIPFLAAGPLGIVGVHLRLKLDDTPACPKLEQGDVHVSEAASQKETTARRDLAKIFRQHWRTLVLCVALVGACDITDYLLLSYMPTYLSGELHYSETHGPPILVATMVLLMLVLNQVGRLNDRYGRKPLPTTGMLGFFFLPVPAFLLVRQGSPLAVSAGTPMLGLSLVRLLGTMSVALPAMFPTSARYGSPSVGY